MARPALDLNPDMLLDLYKRLGSAKKVADTLGVHAHTVRKYLPPDRIITSGPMRGKRRWSAFADWLRRNPDDVLPPSVREIAEVTGISKDSIKSYLYRRRKEAQSLIATQPWKNGGCVLMTDSLGNRIPDSAFSTVRSFIGITGNMKFVVRLKDRSAHIFYLSVADFKKLYQ